MNIRPITPDMDDEDRNVAHSLNALEYFRAGDMDAAAAEVALDKGFFGTFEEWVSWTVKAEAERTAQHNAHRAFWDMVG